MHHVDPQNDWDPPAPITQGTGINVCITPSTEWQLVPICRLQVTWEDFKQFAQLRRCVHKLAVALDFFYTTDGRIGRRDFQRAVVKIMGKPLPEHLVSPRQQPLACTSFEGLEGKLFAAHRHLNLGC